jgi:hypothetical protein
MPFGASVSDTSQTPSLRLVMMGVLWGHLVTILAMAFDWPRRLGLEASAFVGNLISSLHTDATSPVAANEIVT